MPIRLFHRVEDRGYERPGDFLVKEIAHRVDENHLGLSPTQRLIEALRTERQVKACLEGMFGRTSKSFSKALGITAVATGADLCATRYRVPRRVSPFNCRRTCHDSL